MPIALITGGNRGLGRSCALALAEAGVDIVYTYRSDAGTTADEIAKLGRTAATLPLQVGALEDYDAFVASLRTTLRENWDRDDIDFLVNNAGVGLGGSIAQTTIEDFDTMMNVHFRGVYFLTQKLLPVIADGGRIINFSTGLARFTDGNNTYSAYASMKGAIEVFTRYLAQEVGPRGITANVVAPGPIGTEFGGGAMRDNAAVREAMGNRAALGRIGEPEDIGAVVATLLTNPVGWITGQRIEASGGTLL
ncbi:SDR family NAD(P)-dependent oxidoreductase [Mangrovihabitans endophyticus]|uniref:3-oxoacyl-ACP reductase n=1 Tax=Mangrovihabitans endophyticus TaxID=1751298 RepID=A0A8J3C127_9ACTN|nr:SDR family oxidoreductase [Mangrovihabitans endophyticus]GGK95560.1 3-oxoacyl-ACP reductase [Mangrovihabitans endophyticus]